MAAVASVASMPHIVSSRSELLCGTYCPRFAGNLIASKPGLHLPWVLGGRRFPHSRVGAFKHARQVASHGLNVVGLLPNGPPDPSSSRQARMDSLGTLVEPVADELLILNYKLHEIVPPKNPLLMAAADQIFSAGEKRLRPALVFLVSKATSRLTGLEGVRPETWYLAIVVEIIHTAGLIHHELEDNGDAGGGKATVHTLFGSRGAVLAGDFLLAQSAWYLTNVDNLKVIKLINKVLKDFASDEIKHGKSLFDTRFDRYIKPRISLYDYLKEISYKNASFIDDYLEKISYRNASLIAASTWSAAILSEMSTSVCDQMYFYGLHLGMAFQVVDEILDFTQSSEQLGKPVGSDLAKGHLTSPVLFALQSEPKLRELIGTEFIEEGSLDAAIALVNKGGGIERAKQLAWKRGILALKNLECLPKSEHRHSLEGIVDYVLDRIY